MSPEVQSRGISDSKERTNVSQKLKTKNTESHPLDLKGRKNVTKTTVMGLLLTKL